MRSKFKLNRSEPCHSSGDALYFAWKISTEETPDAVSIKRRLIEGEQQRLYFLRSWVIVDQEIRALVTPAAPLDEIVAELWKDEIYPLQTCWVSRQACPQISHEIEQVPVRLGLSPRPEQWPYSSASDE